MTIPANLKAHIRKLFFGEHWRIGTIAKQLGLHPDTVKRAVHVESFVGKGKGRASALDPYVDFIAETLAQYPTLPATRVYEMIKQRGFEGSTSQLRRRIKKQGLRPKPKSEAFFRLRTLPGEQGQVDWAYFGKLRFGDVLRKVWLFVMALTWSRAIHVYFSLSQSEGAVLRGHVEAFNHFNGVCRNILYDNMKTVVVERVGDAIRFHPRLLELAGHYLFSAYPCNPARGNEKGSVERSIRYLRTSFIAGRTFIDLDDMRRQFQLWRDEIAYRRPCPGDPDITVAEALELEREHLLPLPENPLSTDDIRPTRAGKQPYVRFDTNLYSIPHELVGETLTLVTNDKLIRILHGSDEVARHQRCWQRRKTIECPEHLAGLATTKRKAALLRGRTQLFNEIPEAQQLYSALAERNEPLGPQTAALNLLLDRYGRDALRDAIKEAIDRNTPRAASVEYLLARRNRQRPPMPLIRISENPEIQALRVRNHPLEDYDDLFSEDTEDTDK